MSEIFRMVLQPGQYRGNSLLRLNSALTGLDNNQPAIAVISELKKQRTLTQNAALHKYFQLLADEGNKHGVTLRILLESIEKVGEVPLTPQSIKESFAKPVMSVMWPDYTSTTQLTRQEVSELYDAMNMAFIEAFGLSVPFPERFKR